MIASKYQRGSGLPETAIVIGLVLAMVIGVIDFGRTMYTYAFVAQLARQGARWAMVRGSQCTLLDHCNAQSSDVQTYVRSLSVGLTTPSNINAAATWTCPPGLTGHSPGCSVSVQVTYNYNFLLPYMKAGYGQGVTMGSTAQMVVTQ